MKAFWISGVMVVAIPVLAACEAEPGRAGTQGVPVTGTAQPAQQGFGTSQEDRYVTQRGGSSAAMQAGRITAVGGSDVGVTREGPGVGQQSARITGLQQAGSGDLSIQREGVGAPVAGSGQTRREQQRQARRRQQQQSQPAQPQ